MEEEQEESMEDLLERPMIKLKDGGKGIGRFG